MLIEYFNALAGAAASVDLNLVLFAGVFVRMSAIASLAPGLGERPLPMRVRLAAAFACTFIAWPLVSAANEPDAYTASTLPSLILSEALIGLVIGFGLRIAVFVLHLVGSIAAQHISLSQLFGPGLGHDQESPLATLLTMAALAVAAAGGMHIKLALAFIHSFDAFAPGALLSPGDVGSWASSSVNAGFRLAYELAAPFVLLGVAYSLSLAAISRAMPQLMAAFVGAPAVIFFGLILVALVATVILERWAEILDGLYVNPLGGIG
ncbi:MAG: flagellar biosynthetic protein FliR [Parvularculaceae bacterium]